jgi:hypothetical protein
MINTIEVLFYQDARFNMGLLYCATTLKFSQGINPILMKIK